MKGKRSFTLMELLVGIIVATFLAAAVGTTYLFGFRIFRTIFVEAARIKDASFVLEHLSRYAMAGQTCQIDSDPERITINTAAGARVYSWDEGRRQIRYVEGNNPEQILAHNIDEFTLTLVNERYFTVTITSHLENPARDITLEGGVNVGGIDFRFVP